LVAEVEEVSLLTFGSQTPFSTLAMLSPYELTIYRLSHRRPWQVGMWMIDVRSLPYALWRAQKFHTREVETFFQSKRQRLLSLSDSFQTFSVIWMESGGDFNEGFWSDAWTKISKHSSVSTGGS
jgi:hypothetical protein